MDNRHGTQTIFVAQSGLNQILVFVNLHIMMGVLNPMYPSCPDQTLQLIMFCIIMVDINKPSAQGALIIIKQIKVQPPFLVWIINTSGK